VILENVVAQGPMSTRKFCLKSEPASMTPEHQSAVGCALRRAHYLGVALWHIFRLTSRFDWKVSGRPGYVLRAAIELPVAVHLCEEAIAERLRELLGHRLPQLEQLSDARYPMWLGVFAGTLPIETLQSSLEEIFRSRCLAWRAANAGAFCNPFERDNELVRSKPIVVNLPSTKQGLISTETAIGTYGTLNDGRDQRGRKRERDEDDDEDETARKTHKNFGTDRTSAGDAMGNFADPPNLPSTSPPTRSSGQYGPSTYPSNKWTAKKGQQWSTGRR
jgi:hypothetical protein